MGKLGTPAHILQVFKGGSHLCCSSQDLRLSCGVGVTSRGSELPFPPRDQRVDSPNNVYPFPTFYTFEISL